MYSPVFGMESTMHSNSTALVDGPRRRTIETVPSVVFYNISVLDDAQALGQLAYSPRYVEGLADRNLRVCPRQADRVPRRGFAVVCLLLAPSANSEARESRNG